RPSLSAAAAADACKIALLISGGGFTGQTPAIVRHSFESILEPYKYFRERGWSDQDTSVYFFEGAAVGGHATIPAADIGRATLHNVTKRLDRLAAQVNACSQNQK